MRLWKKIPNCRRCVFFDCPQTRIASRQNAFVYDGCASGRLYYFGARYYDPRTSVWQSADPILGKYLPNAPQKEDDDVKLLLPTAQQSLARFNLPGMGGVFNPFNLAMYTYGHQNPVRFMDPDGNLTIDVVLPANRNVPGTLTVRDDFGNVVGQFPALGKGTSNNQLQTGGNTPTGTYKIGGTVASSSGSQRSSYGPMRMRLEPLSGNALTSGRSGIDIHGGDSVSTPGRQGLKGTLGCVRVSNENIEKINSLVQGQREDRSSFGYKVEGALYGLFGIKPNKNDTVTIPTQ